MTARGPSPTVRFAARRMPTNRPPGIVDEVVRHLNACSNTPVKGVLRNEVPPSW